MGLRINKNIAALAAARNLQKIQKSTAKAFERLSTGQRINRTVSGAGGLLP